MIDALRIAPSFALVIALSACGTGNGSKSSSSSTSSKTDSPSKSATPTSQASAPKTSDKPVVIGAPGDSGATITYNPDGPNKIDESKLKGDPATCKKVVACCQNQSGAIALSCQLAIEAEKGDCAKIHASVKDISKEMGNKPPPGCE